MRLDRLDLTRYGRFSGRSLTFAPAAPGEPDLHILYGPNEAGKSTLFSAWLDLLFGIPTRTRYDFEHPGPSMLIGASLTHGADRLEVKRVKKNSASLLDRHDAPIPEAVLQSVLGGLSREGYSAMFSLDEDTLEKGGDSILANRGDLGEMLFSASAGLSSLAPRLEAIRAELDGFHRNGKRSGWLHDAKKQLDALGQRRRELEVSASALQRLTREAAAAEQEWREARAREDGLRADLERLQDLAGTLPLLAKLADLEARLAPLGDLPDADAALVVRLDEIERDRLMLNTRIADRDRRLLGLRDQLAALTADPAVLAHAGAIAAAEALRPEHDTALKDLPRRQTEADEAGLQVATLLDQLGQPARAAADLVLPTAQIAQLRARLAARSGLQVAAITAAVEARKAAELIARERERLGDPGPAEDEAALSALVTRLRAQDPADARARALRDRDLAQGRLAGAIAALAPWTGDGDALAGLAVPAGWQIADWETGLETARQRDLDATREITDLRAEVAKLDAEATERSKAQSAAGITLSDAAAARGRREALWAAHVGNLSLASARAYEQALREDDRISALLAEAMAEARREALTQARQDALSARLESATARQDAAQGALSVLRHAVEDSCSTLGLRGAALPDLRRWLELRLVALEERARLQDADGAVQRSDEAVERASRALASALGRSDAETEAFDILMAEAIARLSAADRRQEARQHLMSLAADLREREAAASEAQTNLTTWQRGWSDAVKGSILASQDDGDPGLGAVLDLLERLGTTTRDLSSLADRVAKMEANRDRFLSARAEVLAALDLAGAADWNGILTRLRRAQDDARDHEALQRQIADEGRLDAQDRRDLAARTEAAAEVGAALDWTEAAGISLPDHLARCREATGLRHEIVVLRRDLRERPVTEQGDGPEAVRERIDSLKTDQQLLRAETELRLAAHLEARRQIEQVGGDDALARIGAERENLLLDLRERSRAHLAARFGLLAVEAGLRRYRDQHRSAMLARASDAFSRLTCGEHSGLAAQPDGAQEVLVALPKGGGAKLAADLSKGARFQLYLALRIAGYHELAQSRPTVPFIADDIMETFDDHRSAAAFALLAQMSRVGQVIYLTHHRHLCDIAQAACPAAQIMEL